jgi:predicted O-methyltransferase YrrM
MRSATNLGVDAVPQMAKVLAMLLRIAIGAVLMAVGAFLGYLGYMLALSKRARETGWPEPTTP